MPLTRMVHYLHGLRILAYFFCMDASEPFNRSEIAKRGPGLVEVHVIFLSSWLSCLNVPMIIKGNYLHIITTGQSKASESQEIHQWNLPDCLGGEST